MTRTKKSEQLTTLSKNRDKTKVLILNESLRKENERIRTDSS